MKLQSYWLRKSKRKRMATVVFFSLSIALIYAFLPKLYTMLTGETPVLRLAIAAAVLGLSLMLGLFLLRYLFQEIHREKPGVGMLLCIALTALFALLVTAGVSSAAAAFLFSQFGVVMMAEQGKSWEMVVGAMVNLALFPLNIAVPFAVLRQPKQKKQGFWKDAFLWIAQTYPTLVLFAVFAFLAGLAAMLCQGALRIILDTVIAALLYMFSIEYQMVRTQAHVPTTSM